MKNNINGLIIIFFLTLFSCSSSNKRGDYNMEYDKFIQNTDPKINKILVKGSNEEEKAINDFKEFYKIFSHEIIERDIEKIYSENAYFRDGYKEVKGIKDIKEYFLKSAKTVHECRFIIEDFISEQGEYYLRWTMHLILKRKKSEKIIVPGMSHLRFDSSGKVIFHQDYWDSGLVFEKLPVIGSIIRYIKKQF